MDSSILTKLDSQYLWRMKLLRQGNVVGHGVGHVVNFTLLDEFYIQYIPIEFKLGF